MEPLGSFASTNEDNDEDDEDVPATAAAADDDDDDVLADNATLWPLDPPLPPPFVKVTTDPSVGLACFCGERDGTANEKKERSKCA